MKLLFLGDFLYSYSEIRNDISDIGNYIKKNNLSTILNLEGPIADTVKFKKIKKRGPNISQSEIVAAVLELLNVKGVCLANNHMMDFGKEGLENTLNILDSHSIAHTGAGSNLTLSSAPMLIGNAESTVRILNFGWYAEETVYAGENSAGCSKRETDFVLEQIKREKQANEILIVIFHWGFEYNLYPMPIDRKLAYSCIDSGADLIIGHHPHNLQPFEKYKEKYIFYSLGNFYMSDMREKFNVDYSRAQENNFYSDLGGGVIFDTVSNEIKTIKIEYSRDLKETLIRDEFVLEEITNTDFFSDAYLKKVIAGNYGINPMLTLDEKQNNKIINKHIKTCQFYNQIKALRKLKIFDYLYKIARNAYKKSKNN